MSKSLFAVCNSRNTGSYYMNGCTLSTDFWPNFATKLCFFPLAQNLAHGPQSVQTFLAFSQQNGKLKISVVQGLVTRRARTVSFWPDIGPGAAEYAAF